MFASSESMAAFPTRTLHRQSNVLLGKCDLESSPGCIHTGAAFISGLERRHEMATEMPSHWNISAGIVRLRSIYVRLLWITWELDTDFRLQSTDCRAWCDQRCRYCP